MPTLGIGYQDKWTSICVTYNGKVVELTNFYDKDFSDIAYRINQYTELYDVNYILLDEKEKTLYEELCKEINISKIYQYNKDKQMEYELLDILNNSSFVEELGYKIYRKQPDFLGDKQLDRSKYTDLEIATLDAIGWAFYQKEETHKAPKPYNYSYFISYHYKVDGEFAIGNTIVGRKTEIKTVADFRDVEKEILDYVIREDCEVDKIIILNFQRME